MDFSASVSPKSTYSEMDFSASVSPKSPNSNMDFSAAVPMSPMSAESETQNVTHQEANGEELEQPGENVKLLKGNEGDGIAIKAENKELPSQKDDSLQEEDDEDALVQIAVPEVIVEINEADVLEDTEKTRVVYDANVQTASGSVTQDVSRQEANSE